MGLDVYMMWEGFTEADRQLQYKADPGAGGRVGYLRSSYNDGGFNSWAMTYLGVSGYYYIFDYDREKQVKIKDPLYTYQAGDSEDDGYMHVFYPNWDESEGRVYELLKSAREIPQYRLLRLSPPLTMTTMLEEDRVIDHFMTEQAKYEDDKKKNPHIADVMSWYENKEGLYMFNSPPTIVGAIWHKSRSAFFPLQLSLVQYEPDAHKWYIDSLTDCLAFIALGVEKSGCLYWSA